ncbi:hypothetical protein OAS19_01945 [Altererythrobacter sp.]|nr:hypothetical protein [Altererythrobacter sp.]
MRPAVVLLILGLALLASILLRQKEVTSFDARFEQAEKRIKDLADDIDNDLTKPN